MSQMLFYFAIVVGLFAIGDMLSVFSKAKLSSIFFAFIAFMVLFLAKVIPTDIIDLAGLTAASKWAMPLLVFHMGTMINVKQLISEWRTVVTSVMGMGAACIAIFAVMPLIGREATLVSIPVINGALVATQIMADAAIAKDMLLAAALAPVIFAVQKFVGTPFVSRCGLREAHTLVDEHRKNKAAGVKSANATANSDENATKKVKFATKYAKYYSINVCIFLTILGGLVSVLIGEATGINYSIVALVVSVLVATLGLVPEKILDQAKTSGFITTVVFAALIPSLAKVSINDLAQLGFQVFVIFAATVIGIFLFMYILPGWKLIGSKNMAVGIAFCQMLGFPSTFLISNEIANAVAENEEEKDLILESIMPKFVVAGLASVTTLSVIVAGVFAPLL